MKIAILVPSRGLIFSRTLESILENVRGYDYKIIFSHDKPIPEAQNYITKRALEEGAGYFLFVEEDVIIPPGTLGKMLVLEAPVVCVDYPVGDGWSTICRKGGKILWCGLGCTLIKREVFEKLEYPWFDSSKTLRITDEKRLEYIIEDIPNKYGGYDIMLGVKLKDAGIPIIQLEGIECGHLKLLELGRRQINKGQHQIVEKEPIKHRQDYP